MAVKTGGGFQKVLLSSEKAGGTSTSCSDLQHHLGCSFPGVTSLLCHLLGDPCALCIPHSQGRDFPGNCLGRFGMGAWLVAGAVFRRWELGWEPLGGLAGAAVVLQIQAPFVLCNQR